MGDPKTTVGNEIGQMLGKAMMWAAYIVLAVVTKLAADSRTARLSRREIVIKTVLSVFAGVMAAVFCENFGYQKWGKVIVPVATLVGEGAVVFVMTNISFRAAAEKYLPFLFPAKKK